VQDWAGLLAGALLMNALIFFGKQLFYQRLGTDVIIEFVDKNKRQVFDAAWAEFLLFIKMTAD